jgi:hypothetical protein
MKNVIPVASWTFLTMSIRYSPGPKAIVRVIDVPALLMRSEPFGKPAQRQACIAMSVTSRMTTATLR